MGKKKINYPGTIEQEYVKPHVQCAHDGCRECATVNQRTATGWAKVCQQHYDFYWLEVAYGRIKPYEPQTSFRERWYAGKTYEPPKLGNFPPFRCVGTIAQKHEI